VEESIARGNLYASAGADGLFLPAIVQPDHIKAVVAAVSLPLNAMAWPDLADATALGKLGVRRLSAGSGIPQVLWARAESLAKEFLASGRSTPFTESYMPHGQLQGLFTTK
jgi:2-methylisocitrate lyase-like PEP mutase family enzyme